MFNIVKDIKSLKYFITCPDGTELPASIETIMFLYVRGFASGGLLECLSYMLKVKK